MFVNRVIPLKVEGGSSGVGLRYVAHGFARHPVVAGLGYAVLVMVASAHFVGGAAKWLHLSEEFVTESGDYGARKRRNVRWVVRSLAAALAGLWMAGGIGSCRKRWVGQWMGGEELGSSIQANTTDWAVVVRFLLSIYKSALQSEALRPQISVDCK